MTKEEIQKQLDDQGIAYDKRFGVPKLQELLKEHKVDDDTESVVELDKEDVADVVEEPQEATITIDEPKIDTEKVVNEIRQNAIDAVEMHELKRNNGIRKCRPCVSVEKREAVEIYDKASGDFIRVYTLKDQGENYKKCAESFIRKHNR